MKLILHCGLNKAGSTYIQNMFVESVPVLERKGIYYPEPYDSGIGNAGFFSLALKSLDWRQSESRFFEFYRGANNRNCDAILLSSEYLLFQIINDKQRNLLTNIINHYGISDVCLVIVFRNIVEHAISAYSHRCGTIKLPKFEHWIKGDTGEYPYFSFRQELDRRDKFWYSKYEFWDSLDKLLNVIDRGEFKIFPVQYSNNLKKDLDDLIGVSLVPPKNSNINKSMTLNQAELCRILFDVNEEWGRHARLFFKRDHDYVVPSDSELKIEYENLVIEAIEYNIDNIKKLEGKLGISLRTSKENSKIASSSVQAGHVKELRFSELEIKGVVDRVNEKSLSLKGIIHSIIIKLKRKIGIINPF